MTRRSADEALRIAALHGLSILDTPREVEFDRLVHLAATLLHAPVALIAFLDAERLWFKAAAETERTEIPRAQSICARTLQQPGVVILPDLHALPDYAHSSFAHDNHDLRFYVAAPLVTADGNRVGALCVLDHLARPDFGEQEARILADMAAVVESALERRRERLHQIRLSAELALISDIQSVLVETPTFEAALAATITRILEATAGTFCQVWEKHERETVAYPLAFVIRDLAEDSLFEALRLDSPMDVSELWSGSLFEGSGRTACTALGPDMDHFGVMHHAHRLGVGGVIGCSLDVGSRRFVLAICFRGLPPELTEATDLVRRLAQVIRPVLQRKLAEEQVVEAARHLCDLSQKLIRAERIAKLGRWRWVVGEQVLEWSDTIYTMYGVTPETFTPTIEAVLKRLHPDDRDTVQRDLAVAMSNRAGYKHEYRHQRPDGSLGYLWSDAVCERGPDGEVLALNGIVQDITERKEAEAMLLHAEKLRSIGQLTGGIAHDFNNLLTVISVNLELIGAILGPNHPAEEARAMAFRAASSGAHLTSSLLAFARRQPLRPRSSDVNALLVAIRALALPSLGGQHGIALSLHPSLPFCLLDPTGFEGAILNLLVNSRDATPEGGNITIETGQRAVRPGATRGNLALATGDYVTIAVSDNGCGIPTAVQAQVFEPFFTTKPMGKGTGLGLSTVIGFVRQSGGEIELASEEGQGITIRLFLPALPQN